MWMGWDWYEKNELSLADYNVPIILSNVPTKKYEPTVHYSFTFIFNLTTNFRCYCLFLLIFRYWSSSNPHWMQGLKEVKSDSVMVWAGIYNQEIVGPFFFDDTVTGESYLQMLGDFLVPELHSRGYEPDTIMFQQDGAPPHFKLEVRHWLDETFLQWIGRAGPFPWPARSPDLTPLDFFLWGFIKHRVYQKRPTDIAGLKQQIREAFLLVTPEMLQRVQQGILYRLNVASKSRERISSMC